MSKAGVNVAVTQDGEKYNKLKRPDSLLASIANPSASQAPTLPPLQSNGSTKRTRGETDFSDDDESVVEAPKRVRAQNGPGNKTNTRKQFSRTVRYECGMKSMFPSNDGLDVPEDTEQESSLDVLAYLNSVRSEALNLPTLVLGTEAAAHQKLNRLTHDNPVEGHVVEFQDGAWISREVESNASSPGDSSKLSEDLNGQEQYYRQLLRRYEAMRRSLGTVSKPVVASVSETQADSTMTFAIQIPKNRHAWLWVLDRLYPTPTLLAQMNERDVFNGLKYITHSLDRFKTEIKKQKSCWTWALLAKTPECGTLEYVKIGNIRDLGHKAGQFGMKLRRKWEQEAHDQAMHDYEVGELEDEFDDEIEEWVVDGDEDVMEEDETAGTAETPHVDKMDKTGELEKNSLDNGVQEIIRMEMDEVTPGEVPVSDLKEATESEADMSISEEEGEIRDDVVPKSEAPLVSEPTTLEDARARLLAQLGDRLVQPQAPSHQPKSTAQKIYASRAETDYSRKQVVDEKSETQSTSAKADKAEDLTANTMATIDMILTVVAECYGQKDLLRFRDIWP